MKFNNQSSTGGGELSKLFSAIGYWDHTHIQLWKWNQSRVEIDIEMETVEKHSVKLYRQC